MFFKTIYNSLFNIRLYKEYKKKSLFNAISYIIVLLIIFSGIFSFISLKKLEPLIEKKASEFYNYIPNFKVSSEGFSFENDSKEYRIDFAGMSFFIDDSKTYLELVLEDALLDNEIKNKTYVGNDGFGIVEGKTLKKAYYFKDIVFLRKQELSKDDFQIIYQTIKLVAHDVVTIVLIVLSIIMFIIVFLKSILYAILLKCILYLKNKKIKFKDSYKLALYSQTFFIIYSGIILFSNMNVILPLKLMIINIISIIYIILIAYNFND